MKIKIHILIAVLVFFGYKIKGQMTITNGNDIMQIDGDLSGDYQARLLKRGEENLKHNAFNLKNARIKIDGRIYDSKFDYELEFDVAAMIIDEGDPEDPPLCNAYIEYKGLYLNNNIKLFNIKAGYMKVPFSRCDQVEHYYSPFIGRPQIAHGSFFSDRDIGVELNRPFWEGKGHIYFGGFTGLNDSLITGGNNDRTGNIEYIGRLEVSYPCKYDYRDVDMVDVPYPVATIGVDERYEQKATTTGADYDLITINGKKFTYGVDFSEKYMGLSGQFEDDIIKAVPADGEGLKYTADYFNAGGWYAQLNYHSKQLKSCFSARLEEFNVNNLYPGYSERCAFAYNYFLGYDWNSVIRVQIVHDMKEQTDAPLVSPLKWTNEITVGWQLLLR